MILQAKLHLPGQEDKEVFGENQQEPRSMNNRGSSHQASVSIWRLLGLEYLVFKLWLGISKYQESVASLARNSILVVQ